MTASTTGPESFSQALDQAADEIADELIRIAREVPGFMERLTDRLAQARYIAPSPVITEV
jgi:hypothetical protein